ncbi:MAG: sigma-70 family RNA polymerase sigma factor [Deltaproteobacteria bacterium]|nr:sigma-70 family RNA polymerase sigma factor [Nannocystaceae bacterium]
MDDDPFTRVYREHLEFVWRLARSFGVDAAQLDDLVHEVFMVVRRRLDTRAPTGTLRAWLAGITRNLVMHHRRGRLREARRIEQVTAPPSPRGPDEVLEQAEAAALMQRFLDSLDPARREVFALVEIEGLSAPEVAQLCDVKLPTVYTRLRAARAELAAFVERLRAGELRTRGGPSDG